MERGERVSCGMTTQAVDGRRKRGGSEIRKGWRKWMDVAAPSLGRSDSRSGAEFRLDETRPVGHAVTAIKRKSQFLPL